MKICIFGAASDKIDEIYVKAVEELSQNLAKRGHSLVFGAGGTGLMGAAARGFKRGGGYIHGVIPHFFREESVEALYEECDKITYTENMSERKRIMEDDAEVFIITPGGIGTFEEFFEVLTLKQLGRHKKAIVVYNILNYYGEMEKFLQVAFERKFITFDCSKTYKILNKPEEIIEYIENYKPEYDSWHKLKTGD